GTGHAGRRQEAGPRTPGRCSALPSSLLPLAYSTSLYPGEKQARRLVTPRCGRSEGEGGEQVDDLFVDLPWLVHGRSHLAAQQLAIAATEAVGGRPRRPLADAQLAGDTGVGHASGLSQERRPQGQEQPRLAGPGHLRLQFVQHAAEQCRRPAPLEEALGREVVVRLRAVTGPRPP